MKTKNLLKATLAAALLACVIPLANAETPAITSFSLYNTPNDSDGTSTAGFEFTLSSAGTLDALGIPNYTDAGTAPVGIWDASGDLLASADVTVLGTNTSTFVYSTVLTYANGFTGVLAANTDYFIGEYLGDQVAAGGNVTFSSGVTEIGYAFNSGSSGFTFPGTVNASSNVSVVGPNFEYTPQVPEPSSVLLLVAGGACTILLLRLRRSKVS